MGGGPRGSKVGVSILLTPHFPSAGPARSSSRRCFGRCDWGCPPAGERLGVESCPPLPRRPFPFFPLHPPPPVPWGLPHLLNDALNEADQGRAALGQQFVISCEETPRTKVLVLIAKSSCFFFSALPPASFWFFHNGAWGLHPLRGGCSFLQTPLGQQGVGRPPPPPHSPRTALSRLMYAAAFRCSIVR